MKYEGTKAFQIHREESAIKATLVFESDIEDELRRFLTGRHDLAGHVFRQFNPDKQCFVVRKLRKTGVKRDAARAIKKSRLAFRRK